MTATTPTSLLLRLLLSSIVLPFVFLTSQTSSDSTNYDAFLGCLSNRTGLPRQVVSSTLYSPTSPSFASILQAYVRNQRFDTPSTPKPLLIVTPTDEFHVQASVVCARDLGMHLKIRSGGHDFEGISYVSPDPFVILDMFNLRKIEINMKDQTAWVEAGATLGELYYSIWKQSKVHGFPAGVCPTVGIGGHISGGGYGNLLRKYGLSVDHVHDARIVDVNGRVLDRSSMGDDLFWAIRGGGGGSFGVVLAYKISLVPVPETVTVFLIMKTIEQNATDLVYRWQSVAPTIDDNLFMRLLLQPVTVSKKKTLRVSVLALFLGNADQLVSIMSRDFPELGLTKQDCNETSWIQSVLWWDNFDIGTAPEALLNRSYTLYYLKRKSDYVQTPIPKDGLNRLWQKMIQLGKTGLVFNAYGGQMSNIPASATPFPHRAGNLYKIQYSVNWHEDGATADNNYVSQIRDLYSFMTPFVSKNPRSAYLNYRDLDIGTNDHGKNSFAEGSIYGVKYFNDNYGRLARVKTAVDPNNFFRNEQSIPVLPA